MMRESLHRIRKKDITLSSVEIRNIENPAAIQELCEALSQTNIVTKLIMSHCFINLNALKALVKNSSLIELEMNECRLGDQGNAIMNVKIDINTIKQLKTTLDPTKWTHSVNLRLLQRIRENQRKSLNEVLEKIRKGRHNSIEVALDYFTEDDITELRDALNMKNMNTHLILGKTAINATIEQTLVGINKLSKLTLRKQRLSADFVKTLSEKESLKTLSLEQCELCTQITEILRENSHLTHLSITKSNLNDAEAFHLLCSKSITHLDLSENIVELKFKEELPENQVIQSLTLNNNITCASGAVLLARWKTSAKTLIIRNNNLGNGGMKALLDAKNIQELDVSENGISNDGVSEIDRNNTLRSLNISNNEIDDEGVLPLARMPALTKLDLSKNKIKNSGAILIASGSSIEIINLSDNSIGTEGGNAIAANEFFTEIALRNNLIGNEVAKKLFENKRLTTVYLANNYLGHKAGMAFTNNKTIANIDYENNSLAGILRMDGIKPHSKLYWIAARITNIPTPLSNRTLEVQLQENRFKSGQLVYHLQNSTTDIAIGFLKKNHALPYGTYFNSLLNGNDNALHVAVRRNDITLLAFLLNIVPISELQHENTNGKTYEGLGTELGILIPPELYSKNIIETRKSVPRKTEYEVYVSALCEILVNIQVGARAIRAGCQPNAQLGAKISNLVATFFKVPALGSLVESLFRIKTNIDSERILTWLHHEMEIVEFAHCLGNTQLAENGELKIDEEPGFIDNLKTQYDNFITKIALERKLREGERWAIYHAMKLCHFMKDNAAAANLTKEEHRNTLLRVLKGAGYVYKSPNTVYDKRQEQDYTKLSISIKNIIKDIFTEFEAQGSEAADSIQRDDQSRPLRSLNMQEPHETSSIRMFTKSYNYGTNRNQQNTLPNLNTVMTEGRGGYVYSKFKQD